MANAGFTNAEIMNTIRNGASATYKDNIPPVTGNPTQIGNLILDDNNVPSVNEFCDILVNKFCKVAIKSSRVKSRFEFANRGKIPAGMTIEEIFVNRTRNTTDDTKRVVDFPDTTNNLFTKHKPEIKALYYEMNRSKQYATNISRIMLARAFANPENGLNTLINECTNALIKGDTKDEFIFVKNILSNYAGKETAIEGYATVTIPDAGASTTYEDKRTNGSAVIEAIRKMVLELSFNSDKYNGAKVEQEDSAENLILFMHKDLAPIVDVYVAANAYNLDKISWLTNVIYLDDFGSNTHMAKCKAILCSKDFLNIYDYDRVTTTFFNSKDIDENIYYTVRQGIYCLPTEQAVAFLTA